VGVKTQTLFLWVVAPCSDAIPHRYPVSQFRRPRHEF